MGYRILRTNVPAAVSFPRATHEITVHASQPGDPARPARLFAMPRERWLALPVAQRGSPTVGRTCPGVEYGTAGPDHLIPMTYTFSVYAEDADAGIVIIEDYNSTPVTPTSVTLERVVQPELEEAARLIPATSACRFFETEIPLGSGAGGGGVPGPRGPDGRPDPPARPGHPAGGPHDVWPLSVTSSRILPCNDEAVPPPPIDADVFPLDSEIGPLISVTAVNSGANGGTCRIGISDAAQPTALWRAGGHANPGNSIATQFILHISTGTQYPALDCAAAGTGSSLDSVSATATLVQVQGAVLH